MKELDNNKVSQLRLIQMLQLKLLLEAKRITTELNIDYFLIAGSLLGSIRHGGFIPWDSDADIAMLRKDYSALIENTDIIGSEFFLQCDETDKTNRTGFAKLRLRDTLFIEKGNVENGVSNGFYIDIFPLDNHVKRKKYLNVISHKFYKYLIRLKAFKNGKIRSSTKSRTIVSAIICFPSYFISLKGIIRFHNKISQRFKNKETGFVNNFNSKYGLEKQFISLKTYLPTCLTDFEGHKFKAPNQIDQWLTKIYGEYNVLPKKQMDHTDVLMQNYNIDFGKYSKLLGEKEAEVMKKLGIES
jgi:lipopolysaccharide cholinephosphotransferase